MLQFFAAQDVVGARELSRNRHQTLVAIPSPIPRAYRASRTMILAEWTAGFCAVLTSIHLASIAIAWFRCRRRDAPCPMPGAAPAVTVLRPVCGTEEFIGETLGSSFQLEYARNDIIFFVARAYDPVIPIVLGLIDRNPPLPATLL